MPDRRALLATHLRWRGLADPADQPDVTASDDDAAAAALEAHRRQAAMAELARRFPLSEPMPKLIRPPEPARDPRTYPWGR